MHLAIVTPFPPTVTGIGQYGYHVSRVLARCGVFRRITVLTEAARNALPLEVGPGITVERVWQRNRSDAGWRILTHLLRVKPDLVWFNLGVSVFGRSLQANVSGLLGVAAAPLFGLRSVVTLHEMLEQANLSELAVPGGHLTKWGIQAFVALLVAQAHVVCVPLRRQADWLASRSPNTPIVRIPLGACDAPQVLADSGEQDLLMFATLAPFKGLELLLDVFRELHMYRPSLHLTVAGAEHPRFPGYVDSVRSAFGDHPAVHWLGYVPETELRGLFARATIVVLPYTAATGASSVIYRAATWGRPVVVSDLPELSAVADEAGFQVTFFRNRDRSDLAHALQRLLGDPDLRAAQSRHNCAIMSRMTMEETGRAYLRAFDLALARLATPRHLPLTSDTFHGGIE